MGEGEGGIYRSGQRNIYKGRSRDLGMRIYMCGQTSIAAGKGHIYRGGQRLYSSSQCANI